MSASCATSPPSCLDGMRDALRRLFAAFTLRPVGDPPTSYVLDPEVRSEVIEGVLADGTFVLRREAVTTDAQGLPR